MRNKKLTHVAFVMDGNGRWAKGRGLSRLEGHRRGAQRAWEISLECFRIWKVSHVTLYAFSSENWNRPPTEVRGLFSLLGRFLKEKRSMFLAQKIRFRTIGNRVPLPQYLQKMLAEAERETETFEPTLVVALNYGSREEVVRAVERLRREGTRQETLTWDRFATFLDTNGIPDPDLIVRTSGEYRLSNYLLLQAAYAELYFTPILWPDFDANALKGAIENYFSRERRFGRV
ncbi:MAG: di-trans,poly-cis-decaprenylcistransferase [Puniceicoccales bacterium]|nr:di-trans,poly-cis-decaprenylcistransferase [Puniceicoccales bacterium]